MLALVYLKERRSPFATKFVLERRLITVCLIQLYVSTGNCYEMIVFTAKQVIMFCNRAKERYSQSETGSHCADKRDWKYSQFKFIMFIVIMLEVASFFSVQFGQGYVTLSFLIYRNGFLPIHRRLPHTKCMYFTSDGKVACKTLDLPSTLWPCTK